MATQPSAASSGGPIATAYAVGAVPAPSAAGATGAEPATWQVPRRFWPHGSWIAASALFGAVTFALGLGVGMAVGGGDTTAAPATSRLDAETTATSSAPTPKPARETQELDEGFDEPAPPGEPTGAPGDGSTSMPAGAATQPPGNKPPGSPPPVWSPPTAPGGTRPPAAATTAKPTPPRPAAPGVSAPPDF
jgi:hypothetical protein